MVCVSAKLPAQFSRAIVKMEKMLLARQEATRIGAASGCPLQGLWNPGQRRATFARRPNRYLLFREEEGTGSNSEGPAPLGRW